ncbi:unnamed protein product [Mytilus edulis]|uniref:BPTI/Kunitz inhibitor domain-containing protein n=1 Tax=Mytilus edulis TaxID=6550 RepID=A0A8S3TQD9_MYTED|nr:unnamed protein product [Mytilus edulis]
MNNLIICHINESPHCNVPHFELVQETQWGLGWIWELKCTKCKFISEKYKLFREIETGRPGRKSASINYGFQTGVINSNIGNDSARVLLTSSCIPPMARTTMQRITNNVCDKVVKLANEETKKVVENFKRRNETLGLNKNSPIKLQMDGTYQSVYIKSRHKMGQNASQAIGIACENETDSHDVIGLHLINKLCWVGAWLRGKGYDVECPNHEHCTANTNRYDPLSEKDLGYEIGKKIATNELLVDYCTTDGDAKSVKGLQEAMQEVFGPLWSVNRLADTIHRGQSQFREGIRANFSVGMFPGVTKAQKNDIKTAFANDIKLRSHGIMKSLFMKYNGDRQQISKCLPGIVRSVVNCYSGNCGDTCRWSITLCNGGKKTSWWYKSINLNSHGLQNGSLIPTDRDKLLIESLLEMKLSQSALDQMKNFSVTLTSRQNTPGKVTTPINMLQYFVYFILHFVVLQIHDIEGRSEPRPVSDPCYLPKKTGFCRAAFRRYFYNANTGNCESFIYGGCRGNGNNFKTIRECKRTCQNKDIIIDPIRPITCGPVCKIFCENGNVMDKRGCPTCKCRSSPPVIGEMSKKFEVKHNMS